ncbi:alpha/beta-hydrolase [Hypoxylon fragiforme]|uniref:alpha/beta-hydrolase n=1 Tax=Hypoxylon fragiforme TaxID=63214 RepID=UPI0020C5D41F|nr:alpha/beta-hydrolase [Hypoxylon fragiforme]KAI2608506.1 alpha/beta-hydrolase [Hypoxylon fragiforme]
MVHGFSDHVNRYHDLFPSLARRGIAVLGFDQRGWGRSVRKPSDRGRSGPTATILSDIATFIRTKALPPPSSSDSNENSDVPVFVLGHSMGGGEALALASTPAHDAVVSRVRGWILEAPFLGFGPSVQPSRITVASGRLAARVVPHFQLVQPIPAEHLTRDPDMQKDIAADPLLHDTGTLEGIAGMISRAEDLGAGRLRPRPSVRSLLVAHGTADKVAAFEPVKKWWDAFGCKLPDATFKPYEGWAHQLHSEVGREEFYRDVGDWILERSGPESGPEAKL